MTAENPKTGVGRLTREDEAAVHRVAATLCGLGDSCCVNTLRPCEYEDAARDAIEAMQEARPVENPKTNAGLRKLPLDLIPPIALVEMAAVLGLGADCPAKAYGRWNWRDAPVEAETYVAAIERHLLRWRAGEEIDAQTGVSHLASIMCSAAIVRDAQEVGTLVDNRRGTPGVLAVMDRYDASAMPVVSGA